MLNKRNLVVILITLTVISITDAQLNEGQLREIDSLLASWNIPDAPGGVAGIMKQGELLYAKSFGFASLDYDIPNNVNTLFNIGSISKQFTAMGIVKLQAEGKLSIDDDIRKYIPDLPDFGNKITIRHLLHHTSGLRDIHSILTLAGWRSDDPRSDNDLFRIMRNQRELNFTPGDEYMYSNTGYIFMAKIIEVVTGENFEDWMKSNIFVPLGLSDTYIEGQATRIVKGNATSYLKQKDNSYSRAVEYWNYKGSGNVHSTVKDLLLWLNNFSNPHDNWKSAFKILQTTDTLNNGKMLNYAFGVAIDSINGIRRINHGGSVGGFRSFACTFPYEGISIVVLTNYSSSNPLEKMNFLAEIVIPGLATKTNPEENIFKDYRPVPNDNLKKYEGDYWDGDAARKIYIKNDTLWYFRHKGNESPLMYVGDDEFIIMPQAIWKTKFIFDGARVVSMLVESKAVQDPFKPFIPVDISPEYLSGFEGKYYSPELDTYYSLTLQNDTLIGYHPRHGSFKIEATMKQDLFKSQGPLQTMNFIRDENNNITGMRVSFDRVKNLWLEKEK